MITDDFPGIVTDESETEPEWKKWVMDKLQDRVDRAYKLGVLHGINAQSMAQVKNDLMEFNDYGWEVDG